MEETTKYILLVLFTVGCQLVFIYLQQRAKNQADLNVKKKLTLIELGIKKAIDLQTDRGKQIFSEEKDSIIVFFAQLNTWIWEALNINIDSYNYSNFKDITSRLIFMQDSYNKSKVSFSKVMLIINDENLINLGQDAINKTFEVQQIRIELLKEIDINLQLTESILKDFELPKINRVCKDPDGKEMDYNAAIRRLGLYIKEIKSDYCNRNDYTFNIAMEAVNVFKDSAQTYIRK